MGYSKQNIINEMIDEIKQLRMRLDGLTQLTQSLDKSREIALAITSLQLSKMWLGKVLKEFGASNPYPESKNPVNEQIEPTADKGGIDDMLTPEQTCEYVNFSHIQRIKHIRAELEKVEEKIDHIWDASVNRACVVASNSSYRYCIEAGMWLGMELGRIRDNGNS